MIKVLLFTLILLTTGCTTMRDQFCSYKMIPPEKPIELDKDALEPCKNWVGPRSSPITPEEILANTKANKLLSIDCINKQNNSIKLIKKLSNNK